MYCNEGWRDIVIHYNVLQTEAQSNPEETRTQSYKRIQYSVNAKDLKNFPKINKTCFLRKINLKFFLFPSIITCVWIMFTSWTIKPSLGRNIQVCRKYENADGFIHAKNIARREFYIANAILMNLCISILIAVNGGGGETEQTERATRT